MVAWVPGSRPLPGQRPGPFRQARYADHSLDPLTAMPWAGFWGKSLGIFCGVLGLFQGGIPEIRLEVFEGMGIFTANASSQFRQYQSGFNQGWSSEGTGYLSQQALGYALASWAVRRGDREAAWSKPLNASVRSDFKMSMGWILGDGGPSEPTGHRLGRGGGRGGGERAHGDDGADNGKLLLTVDVDGKDPAAARKGALDRPGGDG